jgi:hypothetical protein
MEVLPSAMESHSGAIVVHQESRVLTLRPWNLTPVQLRLHQRHWAHPRAQGQWRLILESWVRAWSLNTHPGAMNTHPLAKEDYPAWSH